MKKNIHVVANRIFCLILICALVLSSYPIRTVAADNEKTDAAAEENVETVESEAEQNVGVAKNSEENSATVESEESSSSEDSAEATTEAVTEEVTEVNSEEETTEEVTEDNTEESTTEEVTEEETTEEETTEEATEGFTFFGLARAGSSNATDILSEVSVEISELNVNVSDPVYKSDKEGKDRYYEVTVNANVTANLNIAKDDLNSDEEDVIEEFVKTYRAELQMQTPSGTYETLATKDFKLSEDSNIEDISFNKTVKITESKKVYQWYVVIFEDSTEKRKESVSKSYIIPEKIEAKVTLDSVEAKKEKDVTKENSEEIIGFKIPNKASVNVSLSGLDANVKAEDRKEEIRYALSQYNLAMVIQRGEEEATEIYNSPLGEDSLVDTLVNNNGALYTYTKELDYEVDSIGTYKFMATVDGQAPKNDSITIEAREQTGSYVPVVNKSAYEYDETITYTLENGLAIGEVTCYEVDEWGNEIAEESKQKLTPGGSASNGFTMTPKQLSENEDVYVTFVQSGNEKIYAAKTYTYKFKIKKIAIDGTVNHQSEIKCYKKTDNIIITINLESEINCDILKENVEDFKFSFEIFNKDSANGKTIDATQNSFKKTSKGVEFKYLIDKEDIKALEQDNYSIQATAVYDNCSYYESFVAKSDNFDLVLGDITIDVSKLELNENNELIVEYNEINQNGITETGNLLKYSVSGEQGSDSPVEYSITSDNEGIVEILDQEGHFVTKHAGTANIKIKANDPKDSKYDVYKENSFDFKITVVSPSNMNYTVDGKSLDEFLNSPDATVQTDKGVERWYDQPITIKIDKNTFYNQIQYRTKLSGNNYSAWRTPNSKDKEKLDEWTIEESMPTDYEFRFVNTALGISTDAILKKTEANKYEKMDGIAVDASAPSWNTAVVADTEPSAHSTDAISYFSKEIVLTAYAGDSQGSGQKIDSGAGIKELYVKYGENGKWQLVKTIDVADRYNDSYSISLSEDKNYGKVSLKVVDYLGHETTAIYNREVCIDKVNPVVIATPIDDEGNATGYNGEWTNNQLQYRVSLEEGVTQVSGIHSFEYTYIPRGSKTTLGTATWNKISGIGEDKNKLFKVVLGTKWEDNQQTLEGTLIYGVDGTAKMMLLAADNEAVQMNGTLYVRAESNAGLVTFEEDSINNKDEVRIWQEELDVAKVFADNKSDAKTGWYNKQTGDVRISFDYPVYDAANYAPAVGIVYTFGTKDAEEKEFTNVTKKFYKGIFNEETGEVTEVSDYKNPTNVANLKEQGFIDINTDSINMITVYVEDAAGNKSDITTYEIKADFIEPQNITASYNGGTQKVYLDGSESSAYTLFSQNGVMVDASAEYGISKKQNFYMGLTKEQGGKAEHNAGNVRDSLSIEPCNRGFVYLCAVDGAGNMSEAWTNGIVVDNQKPTGGSQQDISVVTKGKNSADFYNKDIAVSLKVEDAPSQDNYSGLKNVTYSLGRDNQDTESDITVFSSQKNELTWSEISHNHSFTTDTIVIDAEKNESNFAYIKVTATDYAGNTSTVTQELQIDVTKPQIDISFDNNNALNETYYNSNRVARIDIKELNFDPNKVNFVIYKDGAEDSTLIPKVSSWTTEGDVHTTYITFAQDGDYSFEVWCTDLADNESEKQVTDEFTIDQTKPVVTVEYDNNNAWKSNYYSQARTATITVTEHNFNERDFVATITPNAALGGWSHNGDVHKTTIRFDQEVFYSYTVNYTDLAGNVMDAFAQEEFYIDMNSPIIRISGVADKSANAGEVIPVVTVTDNNYDFEGIQFILVNSKGENITLLHESAVQDGGYSYTLTNVDGQPDEIYTLTTIATDMAGNESTLSYRFSLNRNGSVYDLSQISALVETAYVRQMDMQDLQIYEMNVNTVEEFNLYVTRNGQAINSVKVNSRPETVDENAVYFSTRVEGNDEIGYEYEYTIYRESFAQEGIYNIMFYSKDKAGNEVNNTLTEKEAELTFVVDNTAPTVVIDGVESGELYTEETKDINVYVSDNFKLQEANFKLVDEDGNILETYNYMELAAAEGDIVTLTLPSSDKKLHLEYDARDVAGNDITTMQDEEVATSFMITTNAWIRYINNKVAVAGTVAVVAGVIAATGTGVFYRKRKIRRSKKK